MDTSPLALLLDTKNMSHSASQQTLKTAKSMMELDSTNSTPLVGTPIPHNALSDETLKLLDQASSALNKLDINNKNSAPKRKRTDNTGDIRTSYPEANKSLYLRVKNLHKKKVSIAANMHAIKINLKNNKFPAAADFRDRPPNNRSESFRAKWKSTTNACKAELSLLVLEDLTEKYQQTKSEIQGLMIELQQHLSSTQFHEISTFL